MVRKALAAMAVVSIVGLVGCAHDHEASEMHMHHGDHAATPAAVIPAGAVDLRNTQCVVSGDKVGDSQFFEVYQGKVYHFCCSDCPKEFKKDPAKFAAAVAADPAKYGVAKALVN
jgi:YHS domain-containing protein